MHYACDCDWWRSHPEALSLPGLKIAGDPAASRLFPALRHICPQPGRNEIVDTPGRTGWGGNSGFHALNLAVQFGARKIVLIGYDMNGEHWHGRHKGRLRNPDAGNLRNWRAKLDAVAPQLLARGVHVVNASMGSALKAYPKMPLGEALA